MSNRVHYTHCPVCNSADIHPLLTVEDYSVTGEEFVVWQCSQCTLRFTQDVPDADAIGPYYKSQDYISHTNTNQGFINKTYQQVRQITLRQKAETIRHFTGLPKGKLLDVGAGAGAFLLHMQQQGWEVSGVEPNTDARNVAARDYQLQLQEPGYLNSIPEGTFDAITLWHVLERVHNLQQDIKLFKSLLKPKGKLFIAVPNYKSVDADIYRGRWAAYDVPRHLYHFTPKSIQTLVQQHGMRVVAQKPMWFDAFYISLLSSKYKNGKTNMMGSFISGLRSNLAAVMNKERCSSITYIIEKQ